MARKKKSIFDNLDDLSDLDILEEFGSNICEKTFSAEIMESIHDASINSVGATIVGVASLAAFVGGIYELAKLNVPAGAALLAGGIIGGIVSFVDAEIDLDSERIQYAKIAPILEVAVRIGIVPARIAARVVVEAKKFLDSKVGKRKVAKFKKSTKELIKKADEMGVEGGALEAKIAVKKFKKGRLEMELKRIPQNKKRRDKIKDLELQIIKLKEQILVQGD